MSQSSKSFADPVGMGCWRWALVAAAFLTSCAQQPAKVAEPPVVPPEPYHAERMSQPAQGSGSGSGPVPVRELAPELPAQELTDAILYEFLLAEIAAQRGSVGLSAQAYADLAKRTRDPRIARRATEIAVFSRMGNAAIDAARVWHETEPQAQRPLQMLAGLLVSAGRFDEALPHVRRVLAGASGGPGDAFMQLGRSLGGVKDKAAALDFVQRLVDDYSSLPQARFVLAQAAAQADQRDIALREVRKAQELRPDWEAPVMLEAQLLQSGDAAGGAVTERLSRFLQRYPNSREVRLAYARALVADRRYGEARTEFQKLVADFPENTEVIHAVALLSLQLSDYGLAEKYLKRLLELDFADKAQVRLYLGQIAQDQKNYPEALRWYGEVEEGDRYVTAQIRFAQVLARQGKIVEARDHLKKIAPGGNEQRTQLVLAEAQILRDANRAQEAYEFVSRALAAAPDDPDLLYDHAMLAEKVEKFDVVERSLRRLIELRPEHAHAYNALGYTLADRNVRLPEAKELIEKALKLSPGDYFIVDSMGWLLYRMGQMDEALKYLRQAYAGRADPEIAAHLAEVLWAAGRRPEAEKMLDEAVQKNPDNETLTNTVSRLKRRDGK